MKKNKQNKQAFTLVEILISITIFSIIMVSVMMIYVTATDISKKYDINREMRNNIKSVVEDIAEEVRKHDIEGVKSDYIGDFNFTNISGTRLKVQNGPEYRLVKSESTLTCEDIKNICSIVKYDNSGNEIGPLSNSKISFTNLSFNISGEDAIPKVTLKFVARAAVKAGIRSELAEKTKLIFQTTISERALKVK
ncbi:MAG: type II secretion system protein [Candidatus Gracilibacteria bacterium]|nr:type II secretion system protein [Candidatus Gracilibacteria bacterium]MDQ7022231.1 type II secretion system protein [Candidatus Gracilibacteria bacterium]